MGDPRKWIAPKLFNKIIYTILFTLGTLMELEMDSFLWESWHVWIEKITDPNFAKLI